MAFPFNTPTLGAYMTWATGQGCVCQSGYGGPHGSAMTRITAPSGKHVVVAGVSQTDRLVSSQINNLDRRLGLDSPFERVREA